MNLYHVCIHFISLFVYTLSFIYVCIMRIYIHTNKLVEVSFLYMRVCMCST
jgi:hypothetical protein